MKKILSSIKNVRSSNRGFTLVETLVSVLILAFVITGPMAYTTQSIKTAIYARDQVVAFYLTQEAIELIKNARDNKAISTLSSDACKVTPDNRTAWLTCSIGTGDLDLTLCMPAGGSRIARNCTVGLNNSYVPVSRLCTGPITSCSVLSQTTSRTSAIQFSYPTSGSSWKPSPYRRVVSIMPAADAEGREAEVTVSIYWKSGNTDRVFTVRQNITNWIPLGPII